ncbi:probable ubiquitin conjugation factor E4 [Gastrolobium bilobum]|uniref:probable ubiquitin conjugation factor E4 n=1 Tax=Gastrolobium bilobum TaxID=150636 RepID=UPI002AAF4B85|nr:probable ubiquitin conjugation factor E4 [Gastrolobium bilobum]
MAEKIIEKIFQISVTEPVVDCMISEGKTLYRLSPFLELDLAYRIHCDTSEKLIFQYLTDCWQRAQEEDKILEDSEEIIEGEQKTMISEVVTQTKALCVKYCKTHLRSLLRSWRLPLLRLIFPEIKGRGKKISREFMDDMFGDNEDIDNLTPIFERLYDELTSFGNHFHLLDFEDSLQALLFLVNFPIGAKSLAGHTRWIPYHFIRNKAPIFERTSILGLFFRVTALPLCSLFRNEGPLISDFSDFQLLSSFSTIKIFTNRLYDGLAKVLFILLERPDTRENVLEYVGEVIRFSADPMDDNTLEAGTLVSVSAVMLRLCEPFLDANLTKRFDPKYLHCSNRLKLSGLAARRISSSEEVYKWLDSKYPAKAEGINQYNDAQQSQEASSSHDEICERFFLTARVLNLGLINAFIEYEYLVQVDSACGKGDRELELHQFYSSKMLRYEAQLLEDNKLIGNALSFDRLMIVWMLDLVGGAKMPLPPIFPMEFAALPQFFVLDAMEVLIFASRIPKALDGVMLEEFMDFIVMFMASPEFIKNPYISEKMVKVLNCWMPSKSLSTTATLFEGHQLSLEYLVRNLLKLYVDNEFTSSEVEFKDFHRHIAELLEYLWQVPSHRDAWRQIVEEEEKDVFLNFLNFLINNSIRLFDESLHQIIDLKTRLILRTSASFNEFIKIKKSIRVVIGWASEHLRLLAFASEHFTAPFLLPEMVESVASRLNHFLLQLVSPQSQYITLEDHESYESRPKNLLKQIGRIYVHLARGDTKSVFPAAITKDSQSYNDKVFFAAANVLNNIIIDDGYERIIREFIRLGAKVRVAALEAEAMYTEATLGEIPNEFIDPLKGTLMKDPVLLPASKMIIDRSVILGHLLSDQNDPFTGFGLTADMLKPVGELKERIEEFVRSRTNNNES